MVLSLESFTTSTAELLEHERKEEIEQTRLLQERVSGKELQRRGLCVLQLGIGHIRNGLYGKTVLVMEPFWPGKELPAHKFTPGDIVSIAPSSDDDPNSQVASGVVSKVSQSAISVACDESSDSDILDDSVQYRLVKQANDITYRRLKSTINKLNSHGSGACTLVNVLFGVSKISPPYTLPDVEFVNDRLDASQKEAVQFALSQREIAVIHGPPGTGKTTTVVEIIHQAVSQKLKVLACAPSNIAVDNLVERVAATGRARLVRLGHPARLLPQIQRHSLDALLASNDSASLLRDVKRDVEETLSKLRKTRNAGERQSLRQELKHFRKELRQREEGAIKQVLSNADVVMATLSTAAEEGPIRFLSGGHFDLIIIDECSQALEIACWTALLQGSRCILAGDHHQLPPTILSHKAANGGLERTLMERVLDMYGEDVVRMLTVQYRMHTAIMQWSSQQLYHGRLTAHSSVAHHLLRDLSGISSNDETSIPLLLVDTAGCDLFELDVEDEDSKANEGEAGIVAQHVEALVKSGLSAKDIAVIAPYNLQVELLRLLLSKKWPTLEIKSVDGFQGREKEAVIISLVRSNEKGEVGFLAEDRRINVAVTRARRHLAVVCNTDTVSHHAFLKSLVDYMSDNGEVRSAEMYLQQGSTEYEVPAHFASGHTGGARPKATKSAAKQKQRSKQNAADKHSRTGTCKSEEPGSTASAHSVNRIDILPDRETELLQMIGDFLLDERRSRHQFDPSLSSRDRYLIHDIADRFGVTHFSQGEGKSRHIVIEKKNADAVKGISKDHTDNTNQIIDSTETKKEIKPQEVLDSNLENKEQLDMVMNTNGMVTCKNCGHVTTTANLTLHELHCSRKAQSSTLQETERTSKPKQKKSKKKKVPTATLG